MKENNRCAPDAKSIAERELMEELKHAEESGDKQDYIDIDESKARLEG